MARGRRHVPPGTETGQWYVHRGAMSASSPLRMNDTSTGVMLNAPFRSASAQTPARPPVPFDSKSDKNYKTTNRFSQHDNRNSFQDHGVYFGDGQSTRNLGKNLIDPHMRLHSTDRHFLKHNGKKVTDFEYNSTYQKSYLGKDTDMPPVHRRYIRQLPQAQSGRTDLTTTTTTWIPSESSRYKTNTQVLAVSQEPFLKHNPWKYSYNPKTDVYPQYNRRSEPVIDNVFNRYGAAYIRSPTLNSTGFTGMSSGLEASGCS